MNLLDAVLVAAAGITAGALNTVAGGGTLVTYPVLLLCGVPPVTANITSVVGLAPGYAGAVHAFRPELRGQRHRHLALGPAAVAGAALGAVLLLVTPPGGFAGVVPVLVLVSSLLLLAQPVLAGLMPAAGEDAAARVPWPARAGVFAASVYGAYFSAGLGVLLLAVLGIVLTDPFPRVNALKSSLSLIIVLTAIAVYLASGHVAVGYAAVLLVASYAGGAAGGSVVRRISPAVIRYSAATLGILLALALFLKN
ncbi:TSUP family transporter [Actinomadura roseirufa]|uniref:TSUP family transporter n=1 Tax=Actinomadura roseirufa TaxID=2094049 RepID=UPI001041789F|nr:TSUP family transporter [Actinomadura roseirufa]